LSAAGNPFGTGDIRRASLDGSGEETLITGLPGPSQVALDVAGGRMYWVEYSGGDIRRANLDGSRQEILVQNLFNPSELALDLAAEKMYWTNRGTGEIQRANLDGTGQETLLRVPDPFGLAVDFASGKIYWSEYDIGSIGRANLDGTELETLITGLPGPIGLALDLRTFVIRGASSAVSGTSFDVTITALDPYGNIDANYQGTVSFSTTDPDAAVVLPAVYTFTTGDRGDKGVHTFLGGVTLMTLGDQTLIVTDTVSGITGSATVTVGPGT
jgi:hypothetical protein